MPYLMKLTATGAAKLAAAQAGGSQVSLTHIAVGDGNGNTVPQPTGQETALVREVYRDQISALYTSPTTPSLIKAEMTIPIETGGFVVRELGVFDVDGGLFAYGNFPATYKPTLAADNLVSEMLINPMIRVTSSELVQLMIDDTIVQASRQWVLSILDLANILPGGLTGQVPAKASNADGDIVWIDITDGLQVLVDVIEEVQELVASQTVVDFATVTTSGTAIYVDGLRLRDTGDTPDYAVTGPSQITLAAGATGGEFLHAVQNDPLDTLEYLRPSQNLGDVADKSTARDNLGVGDVELFFMGQI